MICTAQKLYVTRQMTASVPRSAGMAHVAPHLLTGHAQLAFKQAQEQLQKFLTILNMKQLLSNPTAHPIMQGALQQILYRSRLSHLLYCVIQMQCLSKGSGICTEARTMLQVCKQAPASN